MKVTFSPTREQLNEIEEWLIEEHETLKSGFYCNWRQIETYYNKGDFSALIVDERTAGFATWRMLSEVTGQILIVELRPEFRGNGQGIQLMNQVLSYLVSKGILVVDLQCEPIESEKFWRKLEFVDVPRNIHYWSKLATYLFKILVPVQPLAVAPDGNDYIELWDDEPYITQNKPSKWIWKIETEAESCKLKIPIIHPCKKDWRIRLTMDGRTIVDNKVKRFGGVEIDFEPYMVIRELPRQE